MKNYIFVRYEFDGVNIESFKFVEIIHDEEFNLLPENQERLEKCGHIQFESLRGNKWVGLRDFNSMDMLQKQVFGPSQEQIFIQFKSFVTKHIREKRLKELMGD